jgi:transposase InsO family protein
LGKTRVLEIYPSESSRNGVEFLKECLREFPFPVRAVQTDNGSTFLKEFDKLAKELGLPHYFIYPRSPKQNTYVEISHGADQREFYQQGNVCSSLEIMRRKIKERQDVWNKVRPHQALNYLTPAEYLLRLRTVPLPTRDVITLQT